MADWLEATGGTRLRVAWMVTAALVTLFALVTSCSDVRSGGALAVEDPVETPREPHDPALSLESFDPTEVIVRLAPGVTLDDLYQAYDTELIAAAGDGRTFLVRCPYDRMAADLVPEMNSGTLVEAAEANPIVEYPEAERREISQTFADGDSGKAAFADQGALNRIRVRQAWEFGRGEDVTVAILDTGLDVSHPGLTGRVHPAAADLLDGDGNPDDAPDGIDSDGDGEVDEAVGHGTFVAGLVLSVAPEAMILPIRILDSDGVGTVFDVIRGIELAKSNGARIINMSFGMGTPSGLLRDALRGAAENRKLMVASAGNAGSSEAHYPAHSLYVLAVAATDSEDRKADFSNFGFWIDVSAPGVGLVSLFPEGRFATWSGTSFATALVSGAAAVLASDNSGSDDDLELERSLLLGADPIDILNPGLGSLLGSGRLDVLAAAQQSDD